MKVRKFTAKTSRDALRQVREDLGPDAAILSNRMIKNGVEIIAVSAKELPTRPREVSVMPLEMTEADVVSDGFKPAQRETVIRAKKSSDATQLEVNALERLTLEVKALTQRVNEAPHFELSEKKENDSGLQSLLSEIKLLKDMMGSLALNEAIRQPEEKARALDRLCAAGFSQSLAMKILSRLPKEVDIDAALRFAQSALSQRIPVSGVAQPIIDEGGVFALVGPTGVGKTTTLAKLAARFVVRHGADQLALISTDGYRIGGQEQLKIYGKLLGVSVYSVRDSDDLARTLKELSSRKLILIDTVGRSQKDRQLNEQKALFAKSGALIQRVLLLNTTCHGDTLESVVEAYGEDPLAGVILSKLDEAVTLGAAIEVAMRRSLSILYATHGQRVPEDLMRIDPKALVDKALKEAPKRSVFTGLAGGMAGMPRVFEGRVHG